MKIIFNQDEKIVNAIRNGLKRKDGYCPCRVSKAPEYKCICEEFKKQPNFRKNTLIKWLLI